jgi:intein/homing endonuclease
VNLILPPVVESSISAKEWWIIGRWIADGHIDVRGHQYFISVGKRKFDEFVEKADGYVGAIADHTDDCNCYQVGLINLSKEARDVLSRCGKGAKNKVVPYEAMSLNKELAKSFTDGYLSGDGCFLESGKIMFTSASRALILGMAIPMQRVYGKEVSLYAGRGERTKEIRGREIHCSQEWEAVLSPHYCFSKVGDGESWKPVKNVVPAENVDVYNIEVADDHSYTAEGCIVKNCPLQLEVINRLVNLWSNEGEVVFTPFLGIGSEVYEAVKNNRRGIGCELKDSYFDVAVKNIKKAELQSMQKTLFD